jgi:hypothetical protein
MQICSSLAQSVFPSIFILYPDKGFLSEICILFSEKTNFNLPSWQYVTLPRSYMQSKAYRHVSNMLGACSAFAMALGEL